MRIKTVAAMDLEFSAVGYGCWGISGGDVWNNTNDQDSMRAVQAAVDGGVTFFDVAPVYGLGHAETVLGKALAHRRDNVLIGSKCGLVWDDPGNITNDLSPASLYREIDDSLRRLNTDVIDIYQMHWPDPATPIEASMEALLEIKEAGKIRHIGVSNFSVALTEAAMAVGEIVAYQGLYNMLERNPDAYHNISLDYRVEQDVLPFCREHGLAFFPYSPLFQGLLTDGFKAEDNFDEHDARAANPKLNGETYRAYYEASRQLYGFAQEIGKPLSQVAINWLIEHEEVTSVICGGQTEAHVRQNVGSADWVLTDEMMGEIARILAPYGALIGA